MRTRCRRLLTDACLEALPPYVRPELCRYRLLSSAATRALEHGKPLAGTTFQVADQGVSTSVLAHAPTHGLDEDPTTY